MLARTTVLMCVAVGLSGAAVAAELHVPTVEYPTIMDAINAAATGDTVVVADDTYSGSGNNDLHWNGNQKHIIVKSQNGPENCIIDCEYTRGFGFLDEGHTADDVVNGFTFINMASDFPGGGITCWGASSPTIKNCIFDGCTAVGAVYCGRLLSGPPATGSIEVNNCEFLNCDVIGLDIREYRATITNCYFAGCVYHAIRCDACAAGTTITGCTITQSGSIQAGIAYSGGGILFFNNSQATVADCIISSNVAGENGRCGSYGRGGGGIASLYSSLMICDSTITGNQATDSGGGILAIGGGALHVERCRITGNQAAGESSCGCGGGVYVGGDIDAVIRNSIIMGNQAVNGADGGGIAVVGPYNSEETPEVTIQNCTFGGNSADVGGAIYCEDAVIIDGLLNCILDGDSAAQGKEVYLGEFSGPDPSGSSAVVTYCNVARDPTDPDFEDYFYKSANSRLDWGFGNTKEGTIDLGDPYRSYGGQTDVDGKCRVATDRCEGAGQPGCHPKEPRIDIGALENDCFPCCLATYPDWVELGKPECWCQTPCSPGFQCDADADGITSGAPFQYRVYTGDLNLVIGNWKKKMGVNACADIDHISSGAPYYYRVYTGDMARIIQNWMKKDSELPDHCPRAANDGLNCDPGACP